MCMELGRLMEHPRLIHDTSSSCMHPTVFCLFSQIMCTHSGASRGSDLDRKQMEHTMATYFIIILLY